ncbi:MAG: hypothetical protein ACYC66_05000 [Chloroflexota bacterium]
MDLRDLESEVQRLVGYDCFVTGGLADKGPYLNFNARQRMLRIWIPRTGVEAKRVAEMARSYLSNPSEPAYRELEYKPA